MKRLVVMTIIFSVGISATTNFNTLSTEKLLALRGSVSAREIKAFSKVLHARLSKLSPAKRRALVSKSNAMKALSARSSTGSSTLDAMNSNFGNGYGGSGTGGGHGGGGGGGHGGGDGGGGGHGGR